MSAPSCPVTLADLIVAGKLLWVYGTGCCRERDVDPASLDPLGEALTS